MNPIRFLPFLILAAVGAAQADIPRKAPLTRYTSLWTNSPFTSKPPVEGPGVEANPLEDYALGGVSPIAGGYRVTLLDRKDPDRRVYVYSDDPSSAYKILSVTRKPGDPHGTVVRISTGTKQGSVAYDEKLLTLKAPPAAPAPVAQNPALAPGQQAPGQSGQNAQNGQNNQGQANQNGQRQPRPRVVAPNSNEQGRSQNNQNTQRTERRR